MIVPEKIKRSQVVAACEALGLNPDLVRSFSCHATEGRIRAVMAIPGLPDTVTGHVDIPVELNPPADETAYLLGNEANANRLLGSVGRLEPAAVPAVAADGSDQDVAKEN